MTDKKNILEVLPGLDCGKCGYSTCNLYADALLSSSSSIDRCIPGEKIVLKSLAKFFNEDVSIYVNDIERRSVSKQKAVINQDSCVGCYKCVDVCPVDAIIGARGMLHEIIEQDCSGCELCVKICPVDCIEMVADVAVNNQYALRDYYKMRSSNKLSRQGSKKVEVVIGQIRRRNYIEEARKRRDRSKLQKDDI